MRLRLLPLAVLGLLLAAALPAAAVDPVPSISLAATTSPSVVLPGASGTISLAMKNSGTATAYQMTATLRSADPALGLNDTQPEPLGALGPGDSSVVAPFTFHVRPDAAPGVYRATFVMDYFWTQASTGTPLSGTQAFSATLTVRSAAALFLAQVAPAALAPGRATNLTFTLHNGGTGPVDNILLTWQSPGNVILPVGSGNTLHFARIAAGADGAAQVAVTTGTALAPGLYALTAALRYTDASGSLLNATSVAGLVVARPSALEVVLQEWTSDGLVLAVSNVGTAAAGSVEVRLVQGGAPSAFGVLLGNLEAGDFTTATFPPAASGAATSPLTVQLSYTDAVGDRHVQSRQVAIGSPPSPVAVKAPSFAAQHPWLVASGAALLAVVGVLGWSRLRHRDRP